MSFIFYFYQFCESFDLDVFKLIDHEILMDFHPRHGYVIPITSRELQGLLNKFGTPEGYTPPEKANKPVLEGYFADPEKGIYGTGHNSVLQIPDTDEWYIVYHRFSRPNGISMGKAAGYHREVCMDRLIQR